MFAASVIAFSPYFVPSPPLTLWNNKSVSLRLNTFVFMIHKTGIAFPHFITDLPTIPLVHPRRKKPRKILDPPLKVKHHDRI